MSIPTKSPNNTILPDDESPPSVVSILVGNRGGFLVSGFFDGGGTIDLEGGYN